MSTSVSASKARAAKAPTAESLTTAYNRVSKEPGTYYKIEKPVQSLKLRGAERHVNSKFANQPANNHFVYWPDQLTAGTVDDIYNVLHPLYSTVDVGELNRLSGGDFGQVGQGLPLTKDLIRANSFDPLIEGHTELISRLMSGFPTKGGARARFTHDQFVMIGNAIKESKTKKTAGGAAAPKGGSRSPENKRAQVIAKFEELMGAVLAGTAISEVVNADEFKADVFTGARKHDVPGSRSQHLRPKIQIGATVYDVPVIAKKDKAANFYAYVDNIIANSAYAQHAGSIRDSFRTALVSGPAAGSPKLAPASGAKKAAPKATPKAAAVKATAAKGVTLQRPPSKLAPGPTTLPKASGAKAGGMTLPKKTPAATKGISLPKGTLPKATPKSPSGSPAGSPAGSPTARSPPPTGLKLQLPRPGGAGTPGRVGLQLPKGKGGLVRPQ
jgi:hypothetical protein